MAFDAPINMDQEAIKSTDVRFSNNNSLNHDRFTSSLFHTNL